MMTKRCLLFALSLLLLCLSLVCCTKQQDPEEIIAELDPSAAVAQFGYSTWLTDLQGVSLGQVSKAFTDAGYTALNVEAVTGTRNAPLVLASKRVQITLQERENGVRVIWDAADLAAQELLVPNQTTNTGEVTLVQVGVTRNATGDNPAIGMCYVYKLADGRAVILDGGIAGNESAIFGTLQKLDIVKDKQGKYQIAAWILSHGHQDHYGALLSFAQAYAQSTSVAYFMYSLPIDKSVLASVDVPFFVDHLCAYYPDTVHVTPHTGLRYFVGNLTLEMLYTPDIAQSFGSYENNTSLIFVVECGGARVLHLGDAGDLAAATAWSSFESIAFAADAFQMTHHGLYTGANDTHDWENLCKVYDATSANTVLLPMGTRSPSDSRNGRHTVLIAWGNMGYQTSYLIDKRRTSTNQARTSQDAYDQFIEQIRTGDSQHKTFYGYDGINTIYHAQKDLTTYIASSETEEMATVFTLSQDGLAVIENLTLAQWLQP